MATPLTLDRLDALRCAMIVGAGILIRLILLFVVDPSIDPFGGDSAYYASGVIDGYRSPIYPIFANVALKGGLWMLISVQSALTILCGVGAYLTLRNQIAGFSIAVCPFLALFDFRIMSEGIYISLVWLGWLLLNKQRAVGAGLLVGVAILARDTLVLLPLFTLIVLRRRQVAVMAGVAYLIALPWVFSAASSDRLGINLWIGTWERNGQWYTSGLNKPSFPDYAFASEAERETVTSNWLDDRVLRQVAIEKIATYPVGTLKAWVERYPNLWLGTRADLIPFRTERHSLVWTAEKSAFWGLNILLLLFGLWGLMKPDKLFLPPIAYTALIFIPLHAESRYTLAALPFLIWQGARRLKMNGDASGVEASR